MKQATENFKPTKEALAAKKALSSKFFKKGLGIGLFSGISYGIYSAFLTLGMSVGIWTTWNESASQISGHIAFLTVCLLSALGSSINDTSSAIWSIASCVARGRGSDFLRCIKSKPGVLIIIAALVGGPIATTAYAISLQMAGTIVTPVSALCPAIGAILARIFYKQKITGRTALGIVICLVSSILIATASLTGDIADGIIGGLMFAFIAALGWGLEGCLAGYGTSLVDSEIGIAIRQLVSGVVNFIVIVPIFAFLIGDNSLTLELAKSALTDPSSLVFLVLGGLFAFLSFMSWYKANSMCGTALGMACNGTYTFFVPFFCWIILGLMFKIDGWELTPIIWASAILMMSGIFIMAVNPLDFFKKKGE